MPIRSTPRPKTGEEERENAPTHPVVQIVDQTGLRRSEQIAITERSAPKDLPEPDCLAGRRMMMGDFQADMVARVAHEQHRENQPEHRISRRRDRSAPAAARTLGDVAGEKRRHADREIAGEFIEADREARDFGPTRSTFMMTVIDQAKP